MDAGIRELQGAWNFRDVANSIDALRPGRLFRSSELSRLNDDGRDELHRLGITDVADLRAVREVERRGRGRVPDGVNIHQLPFPDVAADQNAAGDEAPHEHAWQRMMTEKPDGESVVDAAVRYMVEEYRKFPTRNGAQRAVHRVVALLASGRAVLTHCFAGKDRTGFVVAIVLEAIGLDQEAILADYLRSNDAAPQLRARLLELVAQRSEAELTAEVMTFTEARLSDEVLGVRAEYLAAARQTIDEEHGSLTGYLRDAGITQADVDQLRRELLG